MSEWSFIAQRADTGEFLDWDLPLHISGVEWQLSGPGSLKATVEPDVGGLRSNDGRLLLEEWGTLLYAESGGEIRWGGILVQSTFNGEVWDLEAAGFGTYPHARHFQGEVSQVGIDIADVVRLIWADIQRFPDGNLNVQVTGPAKLGITLGTPAIPEFVPDTLRAATDIRDRVKSGDAYYEDFTWSGCPAWVSANNDLFMDYVTAAWNDRDAVVDQLNTYISDHDSEKVSAQDAKPYELLWWEAPNCGDELDDLAKSAPFDWVEHHYWDATKENIVHEWELAYPRVGRRRDDLLFVQGDNVTEVVSIESNGDEFANVVIGLGAGEGRAMLRQETGVRDGRLRREYVYADKAVTDTTRMAALVGEELNARRAALRIESIAVTDHPNAPIGSWQIGDDVLVRAELPWLGEVEVWCRITAWTLTSESTATLSLVRSDLYRYGGVSPASA